MALATTQAEETLHLSANEKYRLFREKDRVEIKVLNRVGRVAEQAWLPARIKNMNKGGAYCITDKGKETFAHWNDVRRPIDSDPAKPFGALGDIARFKTEKPQPAPQLRALPPYLDQAPPPPPAPPTPPPRSGVLLISREDLGMPRRKQLTKHRPNAVSHMFREQRLGRGWTQIQLAESLSSKTLTVTDQKISKIELGKDTASDDVLLAFAALFALDLDKVMAARDGKQTPAPEPAPAPAQAEGFHPAAAAATTLVSAPASAPPTGDFAHFTEQLCDVVPLPRDKEQRRVWMSLAVKLFELVEQ